MHVQNNENTLFLLVLLFYSDIKKVAEIHIISLPAWKTPLPVEEKSRENTGSGVISGQLCEKAPSHNIRSRDRVTP